MKSHQIRQPGFRPNTIGQALSELEQLKCSVIAQLDGVVYQPTTKLRKKLFDSIVLNFESELEKNGIEEKSNEDI